MLNYKLGAQKAIRGIPLITSNSSQAWYAQHQEHLKTELKAPPAWASELCMWRKRDCDLCYQARFVSLTCCRHLSILMEVCVCAQRIVRF